MANRKFEMYEYRHVIHRMRMGESDRAIARSKLMGSFEVRSGTRDGQRKRPA